MTTIVWDGKILAADKQVTNADSGHGITTKIFRVNGSLVAGAGSADVFSSLLHWYINGAIEEDFPSIQADTNDATFMVISPEGRVMFYNRTPHPMIIENEYTAMGSGRDYALAALHLGCDAVKAVQVACEFDVYSGRGIDTLTL
ncbi:hypothetical protein [Polynucleobacter sp. UK-Kesae-W10]|uniref:hypothetical protein n=1 Tax=Polynucleobacter sp. UK-Kesae-W10 TaxID=1819738 RepID=UPI001C0B5B4C|nr:hypothetical protein [Polynucleobacter sp. UK-Kesae-W10]MBU3577526.1 hypothetical protein [Polynucleobacter sp. UK-Kesae-W10]